MATKVRQGYKHTRSYWVSVSKCIDGQAEEKTSENSNRNVVKWGVATAELIIFKTSKSLFVVMQFEYYKMFD